MKSEALLWTIIMIASTFIAAVSQILLKMSANEPHSGFVKEYINTRVILAYILLFLTTIIAVLALRYIPLYVAASVEALSQVFVAVLGKFILKESMNKKRKLGLIVILIGVVIVCI